MIRITHFASPSFVFSFVLTLSDSDAVIPGPPALTHARRAHTPHIPAADYTPSRVEPLDGWDSGAAAATRECAASRREYAAARFVPPVRWVPVPLPRDAEAAQALWQLALDANAEFQQARKFLEYQKKLEQDPQGVPGQVLEEELRVFRDGAEGGVGGGGAGGGGAAGAAQGARGAALEAGAGAGGGGGGASLWGWLGGVAGFGPATADGASGGGAAAGRVPTLLGGGGAGGVPTDDVDGQVVAFTVGGAEEGETEGDSDASEAQQAAAGGRAAAGGGGAGGAGGGVGAAAGGGGVGARAALGTASSSGAAGVIN